MQEYNDWYAKVYPLQLLTDIGQVLLEAYEVLGLYWGNNIKRKQCKVSPIFENTIKVALSYQKDSVISNCL